jgi:ParB family chromosome partitioning protein
MLIDSIDVPIASIITNRDTRQRRELEGIEELANSIKLNGLINPIVIADDNTLIAGERRLTACKSLGWTEIPVRRLSSLSAPERERIELAENIDRQDLPWKDKAATIKRYHELRSSEGLSIEAIAEELNMSRRSFMSYVAVQEQIEAANPLVLAADKFSTARSVTERATARSTDEALESISLDIDKAILPAIPASAASPAPVAPARAPERPAAPILCADFNEWATTYSGQRFNFLHCDFPYGIDNNTHAQSMAKVLGGYEDSYDVYTQLLKTLAANLNRIVADSAHMIFWYSMKYHQSTILALEQMGWRVNPVPLIWHKSDNVGILPDPKRGPRQVYECALFCSIGDRQIVQPVSNVFSGPTTKSVHTSEKSIAMLRHFFRMTVDSHTRMLDPTCGSSNSLIAAKASSPTEVLGLEYNPEFHARAVAHYLEATTGPLL